MLPLTPANNYTPTILFCGGQSMQDSQWGNYSYPFVPTWLVPAASDCHRITPEPTDTSSPDYVQDDSLPIGRTMGQFITPSDGTFLILDGAKNGTACHAKVLNVPTELMPYGESLASGPVGQPAIYNPNAPADSRWSTSSLSTLNIPWMYHSSALLLPDGSVMIACSNPNINVNLTMAFPTTYAAEYFYPPYCLRRRDLCRKISQRHCHTVGITFDVIIPPTSYSGAANEAADNTTIWLIGLDPLHMQWTWANRFCS